jgi:hypothetical protein
MAQRPALSFGKFPVSARQFYATPLLAILPSASSLVAWLKIAETLLSVRRCSSSPIQRTISAQ